MASAQGVTLSETDAACKVAMVIAAYRPYSVSETAGAFAREVVARAAPERPARVRSLLLAASKLAAFGESVGLELEGEVLLHSAVIERFISEGERTLSPATRRTLRTNLRHLARVLEAHPQPAATALGREHAKPPYSDAEIAAYLACARAQSTLSRRMRGGALVCLGAGAGLIGSELRHVRGEDVLERSGGVLWWRSRGAGRAPFPCLGASTSRCSQRPRSPGRAICSAGRILVART